MKFLLLAFLSVTSVNAAEPKTVLKQYNYDSGVVKNSGTAASTGARHVISLEGAEGLRIHFGKTELGKNSFLRVTSRKSGQVVRMDDRVLKAYKNSTPYLAGPQVMVELVVQAGETASGFKIRGVEANIMDFSGPESICGNDDRTPSADKSIARMMQVANGSGGCTGTLIGPSCMVSAGHCTGFLNIAQFNVPPSNANGTANYPAPEHQYPLTKLYGSKNGGPGLDWAVYGVDRNPISGSFAGKQQGFMKISPVVPPIGSELRITGFGSASGPRNVAQQTMTGPVTAISGPRLDHGVDTMPGNSGSSVILEATQEIIGIHSHGGCDSRAGSNSATLLAHSPDFMAAVQKCLADDRNNL